MVFESVWGGGRRRDWGDVRWWVLVGGSGEGLVDFSSGCELRSWEGEEESPHPSFV
jgi:hypothetical protein